MPGAPTEIPSYIIKRDSLRGNYELVIECFSVRPQLHRVRRSMPKEAFAQFLLDACPLSSLQLIDITLNERHCTIMVRTYASAGPITDSIGGIVAHNILAAITGWKVQR